MSRGKYLSRRRARSSPVLNSLGLGEKEKMSEFTRPLTVIQLANGRWITGRQFTYCVGTEQSDDKIVVPIGSPSDFFSIPWGFRWLLPKSQKGNQAAVLHDYLCDHPDRTQKEIDLIFLEAMGVLKVKSWKKHIMFQAVRAFQMAKKFAKKGETYG